MSHMHANVRMRAVCSTRLSLNRCTSVPPPTAHVLSMPPNLPPNTVFRYCLTCRYDSESAGGGRMPRCLQCLHTGCTACYDGMVKNDQVECPICRAHTPIAPAGSASSLLCNFALLSAADELRVSAAMAEGDKELVCDLCEEQPAVARCVQCAELMCKGNVDYTLEPAYKRERVLARTNMYAIESKTVCGSDTRGGSWPDI